MKTILYLFLIFTPFLGISQVGATINYEDGLGPLTLTYNGLVNGKHSYTTTVDNLTVSWSGTQWEITCCGSSLLFTSASLTDMNPPNINIGNWVDLLNNNMIDFSGSGTASVLPVEFTDFKIHTTGDVNTLKWSTATESNNSGFEIQRSTDGSTYDKVDWVKGNGDSNTIIKYEYQDIVASSQQYYYRLRQVDYDGRYSFSEIRSTISDLKSSTFITSVFPNPSFDGVVNVPIIGSKSESMTIGIYDAMGHMSKQKLVTLNKGLNDISLDLSELSNGMYIIELEGKSIAKSNRFVIAK